MLRAAELVQEPILLREVGSGMRRFVEDYLEQNGVLRHSFWTLIDMNFYGRHYLGGGGRTGCRICSMPGARETVQGRERKNLPLENGPIRAPTQYCAPQWARAKRTGWAAVATSPRGSSRDCDNSRFERDAHPTKGKIRRTTNRKTTGHKGSMILELIQIVDPPPTRFSI